MLRWTPWWGSRLSGSDLELLEPAGYTPVEVEWPDYAIRGRQVFQRPRREVELELGERTRRLRMRMYQEDTPGSL